MKRILPILLLCLLCCSSVAWSAAWTSQRSGNWSRASNNADSPWYDGGVQTGYARVPGSTGTDSVTVAGGHTVTYDYAMTSGNLSGITLTGAIAASTSAGAYTLTMTGTSGHDIAIGTAGSLTAGSAGTAYPATCTFTVSLNGSSKITLTGSATFGFYCTEPRWHSLIIGAASASATTLNVTGWVRSSDGVVETGQDLTTDATWASPNGVRVDNVNKALDSEARTISSVTSNTVVLTAGLTNAKVAGTHVNLTYRNVRIIGYTGTTGTISGGTGANIRCEIALGTAAYGIGTGGTSYTISGGCYHGGIASGRAFNYGTGYTIQGATTVTGCYYGTYSGYSHTIQGNTLFSGCSYTINSGSGHTIQGNVVFTGNLYPIIYGTGHTIQGNVVFTGNYTGLAYGTGHTIQGNASITGNSNGTVAVSNHTIQGNASLTGNTYGIVYGSVMLRGSPTIGGAGALANVNGDLLGDTSGFPIVTGYGVSLQSAIQCGGYSLSLHTQGWPCAVMWDIGGVTGALKAWMYGGRIVTQTGTLPSPVPAWCKVDAGASGTYQAIYERSATPTYLDFPIYGMKGRKVSVTVVCKKDTNSMTETPSIAICDPNASIFSGTPGSVGGDILATSTMADTTNWQTLRTSYTPTKHGPLIVRWRGRNASGNSYWHWYQAPTGVSGGG